MAPIRGVVFDMDGLLIDSEPLWRRGMREVFAEVGLNLTEEELLQTMGVRIEEIVNLWYQRRPWQGLSRAEVTEAVIDRVTTYVSTEASPMPGVFHAFEVVRKLGLPVAIASSSSVNLIDAALSRLGVRHVITAIRSADDEVEGKPHPAVYLSAARSLGVPARHCLAFEDSPNGVLSAKRAGMFCLAVPDRLQRRDERFDLADIRLNSLNELTPDMILDLG